MLYGHCCNLGFSLHNNDTKAKSKIFSYDNMLGFSLHNNDTKAKFVFALFLNGGCFSLHNNDTKAKLQHHHHLLT